MPTSSFTSVQVGTAGSVSATLAPGETRQLWAIAATVSGATNDITTVAVWQSSNPSVAIVTAEGLLKAAAEGSTEISATYQKVSGGLKFEVKEPGCVAAIDPTRLVYGAFGGSHSIAVRLSKPDCRWTAVSDAAWLKLGSLPAVSGTGTLSYQVAGNSTPSPRDGHITIQVIGGAAAVHEVAQEKPVSCSYVVTPERVNVSAAGGAGSFELVTTPADCQWRISFYDFYPVRVTSPLSGTGRTRVTYTVLPTASAPFEVPVTVSGLSGVNPPGIHTVSILK